MATSNNKYIIGGSNKHSNSNYDIIDSVNEKRKELAINSNRKSSLELKSLRSTQSQVNKKSGVNCSNTVRSVADSSIKELNADEQAKGTNSSTFSRKKKADRINISDIQGTSGNRQNISYNSASVSSDNKKLTRVNINLVDDPSFPNNFPPNIIPSSFCSEGTPVTPIHFPLIAPISPYICYNQAIHSGNINHFIPPPPDYFPEMSSSSQQDPGFSNDSNFIYNMNNLQINNGIPNLINNSVSYFQPYSLRSYEISTLNAIHYLIPKKEFHNKVLKVVNDLRQWLDDLNIPLIVFPYGSTSTGFADQFSDLDIALIPRQNLMESESGKFCNIHRNLHRKLNSSESPISDIYNKPPGLILQELLNLLQQKSSYGQADSDLNNSNINNTSLIGHNNHVRTETKDSSSRTNEHLFTCIQDITSAHVPIIRMLHTQTDIVLDISIALCSSNKGTLPIDSTYEINLINDSEGLSLSRTSLLKNNGTSDNTNSNKKSLPTLKTNSLSLIQSRLGILSWYARMDPRVVHVVVLTKVWTRFRGLRNTLNGFPGGYAWTICVIYFFQRLGILPVIDAVEFYNKSQGISVLFVNDVFEQNDNDQNEINGNIIEDDAFESVQFPALSSGSNNESSSRYKEYSIDSNSVIEPIYVNESGNENEIEKNTNERDVSSNRLLYLDVVKGGGSSSLTGVRKTLLPEANQKHCEVKSSNNSDVQNSCRDLEDIPESFLDIKHLNLEKSFEEQDGFGESGRSSVGSTVCTCTFSPGNQSSDNLCLNCVESKYSCICSHSNSSGNTSACSNSEDSTNNYGNERSSDVKDTKCRSSHKKSSVYESFDINSFFKDPPVLLNNVKIFEESKYLKFSQSHTLFYRFLKFIETHLWTTVIDISSPDIVNTNVPGICCDIRNPFPGPPACRPIFDELNQKHLKNEISRAIQIIQSPFGDFSSICGGYLNVSNDVAKNQQHAHISTNTSSEMHTLSETRPFKHFGSFNFVGVPIPNACFIKQKSSQAGMEVNPIHYFGCNISNGDLNHINNSLSNQLSFSALCNDSFHHFALPAYSIPLQIPPPPPPPPPPKNRPSGGLGKKFSNKHLVG